MNNFDKNKSGFTIVEVLVSISIMTTVLFVPLAIVSRHLIQGSISENSVNANLLAQEIIEYVRHSRDTDLLGSDGDWFFRLRSPDTSDFASCVVEETDWVGVGFADSGHYCSLICTTSSDGSSSDCSKSDLENGAGDQEAAFVSGIKNDRPTREGGDGPDTCDRGSPKSNSEFTATLNIIIPSPSAATQYAIINPCVSWVEPDGKVIKKVELSETIFDWLVRN